MAERFYVNCALKPGLVEIRGPEAHHLSAVCRIRPGDAVSLFNGDGHEYLAQVVEVQRRSVTLDVQSIASSQRELGFSLEVVAPLPKGDRAQFLVEKLTELGVTSFVPLRTQRSVVHPREARLEKLERYVIEASKQCGRNVLMRIEPLTDWATYCRRDSLPALRLLAHPSADQFSFFNSQFSILNSSVPALTLAIGPEGGFADEEVSLAQTASWQLVGLGPRILRMETAALVLAAWVIQAFRTSAKTSPPA